MEHKKAIKTLAAERYLLDEMTEEENSAFEEHFFDCRDCADAVRNGATFIDSGKELVRVDGPNVEYQPKAEIETGIAWKTWLPNAAAVFFAAILSYQNFVTIPRLTAERRVATPTDIVPLAANRSSGPAVTPVTVRNGRSTILSFDILSPTEYPAYRWEVRDKSGASWGEENVAADKIGESINATLPSALPAGNYDLVIEGVREDGNRTEVTRFPFNVKPVE